MVFSVRQSGSDMIAVHLKQIHIRLSACNHLAKDKPIIAAFHWLISSSLCALSVDWRPAAPAAHGLLNWILQGSWLSFNVARMRHATAGHTKPRC